MQRIGERWGFYDVTNYPIGGCFRRSDGTVEIKEGTVRPIGALVQGMEMTGETVDGRRVAFPASALVSDEE